MGLGGVLVAPQADMTDPCLRQEIQHWINQAQSGAQDRHHHHVTCDRLSGGHFERRLDGDLGGRQILRGFGRDDETDAMCQLPKLGGLRGGVTQRDQGMLRNGVCDEVE
jgi:hypothetical protein